MRIKIIIMDKNLNKKLYKNNNSKMIKQKNG